MTPKLNIGNVIFIKNGEYQPLKGDHRIAALVIFYCGEQLEEGWMAVDLTTKRRVNRYEVDWRGSAIPKYVERGF